MFYSAITYDVTFCYVILCCTLLYIEIEINRERDRDIRRDAETERERKRQRERERKRDRERDKVRGIWLPLKTSELNVRVQS